MPDLKHGKIETLPDGNLEVTLETGEKFTGSPLDVTAKLADSKVETRRHYEQKERELEDKYKNQPAPQQVQQPTTPQEVQEKQWQDYIVEQTAKGLGYQNAEQFKADLGKVKGVTAEVENQVIASSFLSACPDFPNTPEAIEKLSSKIDSAGFGFTPEGMMAAHLLCVKDKAYNPLTPEEINSAWANNMQAATRQAPPPMLRSGNPEQSQPAANDPWNMKLDDLRKAALAQGQTK